MIKSCFLWELHNNGKTLQEVVRNIKRLGVNQIEIKATDGPYAFTTPRWSAFGGMKNLTADLVAMLHEAEIFVYGWGYNYGKFPELEGDIAAMQVVTLNLDGWVFDVESQLLAWDDRVKRTERLLRTFRSIAPRRTARWSSFPDWRWTDKPGKAGEHRGVWEAAAKYVDGWEPQAYWSTRWNTTPAAICQKAIDAHREILDLPIVPAGRAWSDGGWKMKPQDIEEFARVCRENKTVGMSWWSSQQIILDPITLAAIEQEYSKP